jgi:hypothetical protein
VEIILKESIPPPSGCLTNTGMVAKAQPKKRQSREESEVGEPERTKRKAARDVESSDDSQRIETAIGNCSDLVCKVCRLYDLVGVQSPCPSLVIPC